MKKYLTLLIMAVIFLAVGCEDEEKNTAVTGVTVEPQTVSIEVTASATVTAIVQPTNATNQEVTWKSNSAVATVSGGIITGVAVGSATITATTVDGRHTAKVAVTVVEQMFRVEGVTVVPTEVTIAEGALATVTATVQPANATNPVVTWASNNTGIATVSGGVITGVAEGAATITVTTDDGGHTATVAVTVTPAPPTVTKLWSKTAAEIGLTASAENSIAICGDYVVLSRTGICLNKANGSVASGKTLNVTGIPASNTPAGSIPVFYLANDSKGNMLGATLPGWAGVFNIYKWTSVDAAPVLLYSSSTGTVEGQARKMAVVGDINGHAFIYDQAGGNADGTHNQWEVINGVVQAPATFNTNEPTNDGNWYQTLSPLDVTATPSFFLVDAITNGSNVFYRNESGNQAEVQPSAIRKYVGEWQAYFGPKEWGNYTATGSTAFRFNGKAYGVTVTQSWFVSLFSIIDATPNYDYYIVDIEEDEVSRGSVNGNATAAACYELAPGGETIRIYALFTGESVKCYEMTR
jgi:uncharacterized protein YjdB